MHALLMAEFFLRNVKKSYQALVDCTESSDLLESGSMNLAIGGRPAESRYTVLERMGSTVALLQIATHQGRKHQVRIHCSKGLNAPILLDPLYGGEKIMFQLKSSAIRHHRAKKRFCLHAATLAIPNFGIDVQTPIPDWWLDLGGAVA
jgi:23S rRNA-/tRNA-specific pseudouridylate synthase